MKAARNCLEPFTRFFMCRFVPESTKSLPDQDGSPKSDIQSAYSFQAGKFGGSLHWLAWGAIILLYVAIRVNALDIPLDRDEGIFGYMGQVILDGGLPYHDVFDHKPPVVYYLYALALLFVPPTSTAIHIFLHLYNFLTLLALFFLAAVYTESRATGLWVAFIYAVFSSIPTIQGFTASTEMFLLLPLTLSLLFALLTVRKGKLYFSLASGVCGALAFFTKQTAAPILFFIILCLFLSQINTGSQQKISKKTIFQTLLVWIVGFSSTSLLVVGYLYYHDILNEFIYCNFTYNYVYSKSFSLHLVVSRLLRRILAIFIGNVVLIVLGLLGCLAAAYKQNSRGYFALGLLFFSLLAVIPGIAYHHYFAQIAPAIAITGGFGIDYLIRGLRNKRIRTAAAALCVVAIMVTPVLVHSGYYFKKTGSEFSRDFFQQNLFPESADLAKFLTENTSKEESVFIFGSEAQILFLAQRKSATSFVLIYPLMSNHPKYKEFQKRAVAEVNRNLPKYVIVVDLHTSHLWDHKADLTILGELRKMVAENYYIEAVMKIENTKGELYLASEIDNFIGLVKRSKFPIIIFKRKS